MPPDRLTARLTAAGPWLALLFMATILLAHGGLLPLGRWQGDEYIQAAFRRDYGFAYLVDRLSGTSPRPVSETVLFAYFWVVTTLRRPLIGAFLMLHWAMLAASCFASLRWRPRERLVWRLLFGASVLCLFVVGHDVSQMFFWPDAAAPYLETLAALGLLLFLTLDGRTDTVRGTLAGMACLTLAAASSEAGAMFALPYAALRLAAGLRTRFGRRSACAFGWGVPFALAAVELGVIATSARLGAGEPASAMVPTLHRPLASLMAGLPQLGTELISRDGSPLTRAGLAQGLAIKLCVFLALRWCWRLAAPDARSPAGLTAFAVATVVGAFGMIVAAEYQLGTVCCDRHAALRQCWMILAIGALSALSAPRRVGLQARRLTPVLLVAAAGLAFLPRLPGLISDYGLRTAAVEARAATWRSGLAPGPAMTLYPPPPGRVVVLRDGDLPPGHYVLSDQPPWWALGILRFFNKQVVDIAAARARDERPAARPVP
jgi:hypothetical protein